MVNKNKIPAFLWSLGLATVCIDRILVFEYLRFTIKFYYFCFTAAWIFYFFTSSKTQSIYTFCKKSFEKPWLYLTLLVILSFALLPFSSAPFKSFGYCIRALFVLYFVAVPVSFYFSKERDFELPFNLMVGSLVIQSIVILIDQIAFFDGFRQGFIGYNQAIDIKYGMSRPCAFSFEPSYLSIFFCFGQLWILQQLTRAPTSRIQKLVLFGSLFLSLLAFLIMASRTGWITFFIGLSVLIANIAKRKNLIQFWKPILGFLGAILAGFVMLNPGGQLTKFFTNSIYRPLVYFYAEGSQRARIDSMVIGLKIGKSTHFIGTGLGGSFPYWVSTQKMSRYDYGDLDNVFKAQVIMSTWAEVFAELGLIGLVLLILFSVSIIKSAKKYSDRSTSTFRVLAYASSIAFLVFGAHWIPNFFRADVWVWYGLWISWVHIPE